MRARLNDNVCARAFIYDDVFRISIDYILELLARFARSPTNKQTSPIFFIFTPVSVSLATLARQLCGFPPTRMRFLCVPHLPGVGATWCVTRASKNLFAGSVSCCREEQAEEWLLILEVRAAKSSLSLQQT